ncbi:NUDIX domain-containing protein [Candidatus Woesearchaeota archaeon]|nr:NUDIX domain-containing protein [Candidatus Woesearchaeota archaeon]
MEISHPMQRGIVLKLIHSPGATFTELLADERDSNKFAYHLGKLDALGLIVKSDGKYTLSEEGKKLSSFIEGDTGEKAAFPTFNHVLICKDGDKILVQKRLKEPFYGYWGLISGKINYGWNVEECALRDIEEETGLVAGKAELVGMNQTKTYEDGKLLHHHIMFYVRLSDFSGTLISKTHKGENRWVEFSEYLKLERFPDQWLREVLDATSFVNLEMERYMKDGKFVDCKLKRISGAKITEQDL